MRFLPSLASTSQASPLLDLLEYLVNNKAPANDYNTNGVTPLNAITLSERNLFGHTPLHLAAGKPSILRVLVDAADIALLNLTNTQEFSALDLAVSVSEQLCLESKHVLDSDAFEVTLLLQQTGICVPEALAVVDNEWFFRQIYQLVDSIDDADLLFRARFRDTASWCDADDVERWAISPPPEPLSYLRWLANHDGIYCRLPFPTVEDIFGSACIFSAIGYEINNHWTRRWSKSDQSCESESGHSLPASSTTSTTVNPDEDWYHEVHSERWHHYATIRFITFAALEISHSCCRTYNRHRLLEDDSDSDENGLGDDQGYKLELLEDLINEFEETMTSLLENPDTGTDELIEFWERVWVGRMSEVLDRLEGCDLPEDEKLAPEEIGVVWDK
ncbi:hypothetical protein LB506_011591, partial [Fusarium annulatum]